MAKHKIQDSPHEVDDLPLQVSDILVVPHKAGEN